MRESRTYGSVRGTLSNGRPYRDTAEAIQSQEGSLDCFVASLLAMTILIVSSSDRRVQPCRAKWLHHLVAWAAPGMTASGGRRSRC